MATKRVVGVQFTPRLVPVSYALAEVVGSGAPPPVRLVTAAEVVNEGRRSRRTISEDYAHALLPGCTLIFMAATSPGAMALRERDIELLRKAYDEDKSLEDQLARAAVINYLEAERQNYLVAVLVAGGGGMYLSPSVAGKEDLVRVAVDYLVGEIHPDTRFWAFGFPKPIDVKMLPDVVPKEVGLLNLISENPVIAGTAGVARGKRALPVVDPLLILRGTTQRYNACCDDYLTHRGNFDSQAGHSAIGAHAFYKSKIAEFLKRLPDGLVKDPDAIQATARAKEFLKRYEGLAPDSSQPGHEGVKQYLERREDLAHAVITWLESESLALVPKLYRKPDGTFATQDAEDGYLAYLDAVLMAHSRLTESERGKIYLLKLLDGREPVPSGHPWEAVREFVLTVSTPSDPTAKFARKASKGIVGLWLKLLPLVLERIGKDVGDYEVSGIVYRKVNEAVRKMTDHIAYLFHGPGANTSLFNFVDAVRTTIQIKTQDALAEVYVSRTELRISKESVKSVLDDSKDAARMLERAVELINASVAFASCWEAVRDSKYDLKHLGHGLDLLKSVTYFSKEGVSRELRKATLEAARQEVLEKLTARLTLAGTIIDLASTGVKTWEAYRSGDKDAASAELVAGSTGVLGTLMLTMSGPVGWTLLALSLGVALYGQTLKDMPFDKLAKFSPFGPPGTRRSSEMAEADKAWTMADSYHEWDPNKSQGLERWLGAAAQLAFGFTVQGFTPQSPGVPRDGHVRIEAQQPFLPASRLHIRVEAKYANQDPLVKTTETIVSHCWVLSLLGTPTLADYSGKYLMVGAVEVIDQRIVELSLRQVEPLMAKDRGGTLKYMDLHTLVVEVRLDVHGDGDPIKFGEDATLIVPTMKGGKRRVRATVLKERELQGASRSYELGSIE